MKESILTFLTILFIYNTGLTQVTKTIYFDKDWNVVSESSSYSYYRTVKLDETGKPTGFIHTYYKSGKIQWKGKFISRDIECTSCDECLCDGVCTWYHENGKKSSETNYRAGKVIGEEKYWDEDGNPRNLKAELASLLGSRDILQLLIKSNIKNNEYDQLQGIWDVEKNTQLFINKELYHSEKSSSQLGIILLDGNYSVFTVNKGRSSLNFFPTYDKNTFEVSIKDSGYTHKGTAKIISDNYMKVVITGNRSFIRNKYGTETARISDVFFEMNFRKDYPLKSDLEDILKEIIEESPTTGSGFAISSNLIVTNHHVVESARTISVRGINGDFSSSVKAFVIRSDPQSDLTILGLDNNLTTLNNIPYALRSELAEVGEDIYVLGYPLTATMGEEIKLTTGIISSLTGYQGSIFQYQVSAPIQPGNSGSPLFDKDGYVIGVVSSKHLDTENVSYVIKSSYLKNLLDLFPEFQNPPNTLKGKSLSEQVKEVKDYIFLIEVNHE